MPVGYAMLRVLRESEYLRRASDPKKFLAEAERLGERVAGQPKGARGQRISAWNGFHGRRSLASAGHFTTRHDSSRHQHRCSRHDEVAGLHKSERAIQGPTAAAFFLPTASVYSTFRPRRLQNGAVRGVEHASNYLCAP